MNNPSSLALLISTGYYETQVLKLHLSGAELAWYILPAILIIIIITLIIIRLVLRSGGDTNFTDPIQATLLAAGSP